MKFYALATAILLGFALNANATTVYDEGVSGDITDTLSPSTSTDIGLLGTGANTVVGSLDGGPSIPDDPPGSIADNGPDEFDVFFFSTTGNWTVDFLSTSGLSNASVLYYIGTTFTDFASPTSGATDVFGGPVGPGSYAIALLPPGNTGALGYELTINVSTIPIPAAAWLFGSALLGLGIVKRKKAS